MTTTTKMKKTVKQRRRKTHKRRNVGGLSKEKNNQQFYKVFYRGTGTEKETKTNPLFTRKQTQQIPAVFNKKPRFISYPNLKQPAENNTYRIPEKKQPTPPSMHEQIVQRRATLKKTGRKLETIPEENSRKLSSISSATNPPTVSVYHKNISSLTTADSQPQPPTPFFIPIKKQRQQQRTPYWTNLY